MNDEAHFLSVELDVRAKDDLAALCGALEPVAFVIEREWADGDSGVSFGLVDAMPDAVSSIEVFLTAISNIDTPGRAAWDRCEKTLSVGFVGGTEPNCLELVLESEIVRRIADERIALSVSIYAAGAA